MDQLTLGGIKIDVEPMSWKTQKQVFKLLTRGLGELEAAQRLAGSLIKSMAAGRSEVTLGPLMELLGNVPELLTEVLSVGLGVDKGILDDATGGQVMAALEQFIQVNALDEQLARAKKAFSLLTPAGPAGSSTLAS